MKYAIVVDSSCDMNFTNNNENNTYMARVPLKLRVGDMEYADDADLDVASFMKEMKEFQGVTGSAAPSPQEWYNEFKKADMTFAVTITSRLSGSYSSAVAAKDMILEKYPEKKIHIVDSKAAGPGLALIVKKLQQLIQEDKSFEEIVKEITEFTKKVKVFFILESMDNLIKNGRVNAIAGKLAGILGIKILGKASDKGTIELVRKARGKDTIYKKTVEDILNNKYNGGKIMVSHCFNKEKANMMIDMIKEKFSDIESEIVTTGGLCSYYAEEKGLIIAFETEN